MALEVELKFLGSDHAALRERLQALGAVSEGKHLEQNLVFDNAEGTLRPAKTLLRLRRQLWPDKECCVLTLKKPLHDIVRDGEGAKVKVRQENEIAFAGFDSALHILRGLGYHSIFAYDKVREEFALTFPTDYDVSRGVGPMHRVHIALDSLIFGDIVEIEGSEEAIFAAAHILSLDGLEQSSESYHALNRAWREENAMPMQDDFSFDQAILDTIYAELALPTIPHL